MTGGMGLLSAIHEVVHTEGITAWALLAIGIVAAMHPRRPRGA